MKQLIYAVISLIIVMSITLYAKDQDRKELIEKRTYNSKTYLNSDNNYTMEISIGPIHFKNEQGEFEKINRNIVSLTAQDYNYGVTAGLYHSYFKSDLSQPYPVAFETKGGAGIQSKLSGIGYLDISSKEYHILQHTQPTEARMQGNEIYYHDVFKNVDVKYIYTDTRLKEEIYLSQEARESLPNPVKYGLTSANTYLVFITELNIDMPTTAPYAKNIDIRRAGYEGEDCIEFKDLRGKLKFFFPVDEAFLESERDSVAMEHKITIKKHIISKNGSRYLISGVPLKWIYNLPKGTVVFDPQVAIQPDSYFGKDAFVYKITKPGYEYVANTNYSTQEYLYIAAWTHSGFPKYSRAFLQFNLSEVPKDANISEAILHAYWPDLGTQHSYGDPNRYGNSSTFIRRVEGWWDESTITWNNKPSYTTTNEVSVDAPSSGTSDFTADVSSLVDDIRANVNYGFIWMLQNEVKYRSIFLGSSDHSLIEKRPKLIINFSVPTVTTYYIHDASGRVIATYRK